ncbi:MAG: YifB family Mg chelatase-like AAA ATPase [Proteobacteria bacterium]|jgi:magnesium chelatase family protein|nr:YifB family Mg chelatase-like AAA ATPase [Pseudomonadota bacterium]MBK7117356.1 YifB family Mg chelatase-like AAA ATPase [Pseudomonadota bacterium]MCC6631542.1 YifB family Mg chelatase-like AAA ATPase [Gammaproteobacteria bacterium]
MGFAQILSRAEQGLTAPLVRVEVHLGSGLPTFNIVGLAAPVVRESRERVRAALAHCGFAFPAGRITVNLAPADLPKEGGRFDLPIALGILVASNQVRPDCDLQVTEFYGELGLTGELKSVAGLLLAALHAARDGHSLVVPRVDLPQLRIVEGCTLRGIGHLAELAGLDGSPVAGSGPCAGESGESPGHDPPRCAAPSLDLSDVRGQWQARRALLIAAAGGHALLMCGPPGSGKSMLAQRLPGLLPALSREESLEVAAIAAVARTAAPVAGQGAARPFRAPHHTASAHAIVGGGVAVRPGEVSLAHHGVLFLDELPEFDRRVLEALREPLESGLVSVVRANQRAQYPARFQLVAAMNPCPCGRAGQVRPRCECPAPKVQHYRARISGPLLDRIDLQLTLPVVEAQAIDDAAPAAEALTTAQARELVCAARARQQQRQGCCNARLGPAETLLHCRAEPAGMQLLRLAVEKQGHSARAQHRILRVARSIADLDSRDAVIANDVAEALAMRWER